MKIYIAHNRGFDVASELYGPIQQSGLRDQYEIVLPHENSDEPFNSREYLKTAHLVVAEVSFPSTGLGIELGWADQYGCSIVAIHKVDQKPSGSVRAVSEDIRSYDSSEELITTLREVIDQYNA